MRGLAIALALVSWESALGQTVSAPSPNSLPKGELRLEITGQDQIRGSLFGLSPSAQRMSAIALPFGLVSTQAEAGPLSLHGVSGEYTVVAFVSAPGARDWTKVLDFSPAVPQVDWVSSPDNVDDVAHRSGIAFQAAGLQRTFVLDFSRVERLKADQLPIDLVRVPQTIVVTLPPSVKRLELPTAPATDIVQSTYDGRTASFVSDGIARPSSKIKIRYDLPEPSWVGPLMEHVLKFLGMFVPLFAIPLTVTSAIDRRRYLVVLGAVATVYVGAYAYLFYTVIVYGGGMWALLDNAGFVVGTVVVAAVTYWVKIRSAAVDAGQVTPASAAAAV
jgi:hypothetical protein